MFGNSPRESIVVTIGYRDSLVTVQHNGAILWGSKFGFGVVDWVFSLVDHLRTERNLLVGRTVVESVITQCGGLLVESETEWSMEIHGRNAVTGEPDWRMVFYVEVASVMNAHVLFLTDSLKQILRRPPHRKYSEDYNPRRLPDIYMRALNRHGIVLDGEYADTRGLDRVLQAALKLRVRVERDTSRFLRAEP